MPRIWKSHGGPDGCRNFRNLYLYPPNARPVLVKVDLVQADVGATKWVAPLGLLSEGSSTTKRPPPAFAIHERSPRGETFPSRRRFARAAGGMLRSSDRGGGEDRSRRPPGSSPAGGS